ncbi:unnamed protein product [Darwinula stevensoni]|uniref:cyclin-dependent kinase n=1 Tax=Darwinula stevensoni TaxID=69355 RepID=A0A7R8X0U1_9CRUS|nr:unnamed protein product [Darwinula stevensoni]CAG0879204.1 unnamed protein product [Darwinula stevensoni]
MSHHRKRKAEDTSDEDGEIVSPESAGRHGDAKEHSLDAVSSENSHDEEVNNDRLIIQPPQAKVSSSRKDKHSSTKRKKDRSKRHRRELHRERSKEHHRSHQSHSSRPRDDRDTKRSESSHHRSRTYDEDRERRKERWKKEMDDPRRKADPRSLSASRVDRSRASDMEQERESEQVLRGISQKREHSRSREQGREDLRDDSWSREALRHDRGRDFLGNKVEEDAKVKQLQHKEAEEPSQIQEISESSDQIVAKLLDEDIEITEVPEKSSASSTASSSGNSTSSNSSEEEGEEEEEEEGEARDDEGEEEKGSSSDKNEVQASDSELSDEDEKSEHGEGEDKMSTEEEESEKDIDDEEGDEAEGDREDEEGGKDESTYVEATPPPSPPELKLPPYLPGVQGCRRVEEFHCLNRIEEGTYGVVYRARDKRTDEIVALKRLKMEKEKEGFPITSLREINTLLKAQHQNIVTVREIVVGSDMDKIYIVMDYVEHDLKSLMETMKTKNHMFVFSEIKTLMIQLLHAVAHLHDNWILHRDLKTSNLLLSHKGVLKVGDFGLAREYGSPLKPYTPVVVTLWYRAPELLLGVKEYSTPIDLWSVGCIFGELIAMEPMFQGKSDIDQLNKIFKDLGTPNEKIWPGYSELPGVKKMSFAEHPYNQLRNRFRQYKLTELGFDFLNRFLTYCPSKRITAEEALKHEWLSEKPFPKDPSMFPTWPAKSELGHRKRAESPKPPSGGGQYYKQMIGEDDEIAARYGFPFPGQDGVPDASKVPGFSLKF